MKFLIAMMISVFLCTSSAMAAEKFEDLIEAAKKLKEEQKYPQAIAELSWAQDELGKLHTEKLKSFFPEQLEGFQAEQFKSADVMGLKTVERTYKSTDGSRVKVTLLGGSGKTGGQAGLGALAGFAQMAAMMDGQPGVETVRVHGKRGTLMTEGANPKLMISLNSGMTLNVEGQGGSVQKEKLVTVAEAVDVSKLETYLATN